MEGVDEVQEALKQGNRLANTAEQFKKGNWFDAARTFLTGNGEGNKPERAESGTDPDTADLAL